MKIVGFIPLKWDSERVQGKNAADLRGKPLYLHMAETLAKAEVDELVMWSTERIKMPEGYRHVDQSKPEPGKYASVHDFTEEFASKVDADIYVMAFATSPFLTVESINKCIAVVREGYASCAFTVKQICPFIWRDGKPAYDIHNQLRTQDLPRWDVETTGLYVYTKELALTRMRLDFGGYMHQVSAIEAIDVDYPTDLELARAIKK